MIRKIQRLAIFAGLSFFVGCASYQSTVSPAREKLKSGQIEEALADFEKLAEKKSGDQLVYLLDYAAALQYAGKTKESTKYFLRADKLAEAQDYHSVSNLAGSLLFSQEMVQYKGDTFEQIFINAFLAFNFMLEGNLDDALVEARRINEKYLKLRREEKQKFELNPFSKYLSALLWEADQKYDDAYIAYNEAYELDLESPMLRKDLLRAAILSRRDQEYDKWKKKFPEEAKAVKKPARNEGEIVILFLQGWGPRKVPDPQEYRFPTLVHVSSETQKLSLTITPEKGEVKKIQSEQLYNVEQAAMATLREDRGILIAKRVAGIVAKEVAADQIRQKNEALGAVAWIAMHATDRADVRQWSLLPETIQIVRVPIEAGKYKISAEALTDGGTAIGNLHEGEVVVKPGKKNFLVLRSIK